jgi:phosphopantothenoylcysteine synthetase/decarboxylase
MRFLVTAGNTREMIDRVRAWGNIFTGNTGFAIAKALAEIGEVELLTSNASHFAELASLKLKHGIQGRHFSSHDELRSLLAACVPSGNYDAIFMTAAVADYKPIASYSVIERTEMGDGTEHWIVQNVSAGKVKSAYREIAFLGEQTEKLIDLFRRVWKYKGLLVKFKLEVGLSDDGLIEVAQKSRAASKADYIVANTLDMVQGERAGAYLISDLSHEWVPRDRLAETLVRLVKTGAK